MCWSAAAYLVESAHFVELVLVLVAEDVQLICQLLERVGVSCVVVFEGSAEELSFFDDFFEVDRLDEGREVFDELFLVLLEF